MKYIHIGSAVRPPSSPAPSERSWSKPTHTVATRFGVEAAEPRVAAIVGRAGLAGEVAALEHQRARGRAAPDDVAHHVGHQAVVLR